MPKLNNSFKKWRLRLGMHPDTTDKYSFLLQDTEAMFSAKVSHESPSAIERSDDPIVNQGWALKNRVESQFINKRRNLSQIRVLIHVPDFSFSPAGNSLFSNLLQALRHLGIACQAFEWNHHIREPLQSFRPTILLTSDHSSYLERIDWLELNTYRSSQPLLIGLTASLAEYGNSRLEQRLAEAKSRTINFYYTFRDQNYVQSRPEYRPFFEQNYSILSLPFGANISCYYPLAHITRDLNYVLIATRKREHDAYLWPLARHYSGFLGGPGWSHSAGFIFHPDRDRYFYARAKIGLNVHLPEQLEWASELNERTYQLAACGTPQLIDHPKLLDAVFPSSAIFCANSPKEFFSLFKFMLANPKETQKRALLAQKIVFENHTWFHRADALLNQLLNLSSIKTIQLSTR